MDTHGNVLATVEVEMRDQRPDYDEPVLDDSEESFLCEICGANNNEVLLLCDGCDGTLV